MTTTALPPLAPPAGPTAGAPTAAPTAVLGSLSPSRAGDFMTCPLLYRFRSIDRLPQQPSVAAVRGTVVHAVLERLYDLPRAERTVEAAEALLEPAWRELRDGDPATAALFAEGSDERPTEEQWLQTARALLAGYFALEDPTRLEPAEREAYVEAVLPSGLVLRGYVDRLDEAPDGALRVVDYKTGRIPGEAFEAKALFQMKFYALVLWRTRGVVPRVLQLMYLGDKDCLRYTPDEADLRATERKLEALWAAISRATERQDFRPNRSRLCDWCDHRALCPEFGGTPPPWPGAPAADQPPSRRPTTALD